MSITLAKRGHSHETIRFGVVLEITRLQCACLNASSIITVHTNHATNSLCHLNDVKITQQNALSQTRAVDTFRENRVMEEYKLLGWVFTIGGESVKEYLTIHLLLVDIGTKLRGDVQHFITTLHEVIQQRGGRDSCPHHFRRGCCNQHLLIVGGIVKNGQNSISVNLVCILFGVVNSQIEFLHFRRNDATIGNQTRCRNVCQHGTINLVIIHATGVRIFALTRRRSEVKCFLSMEGGSSNCSKEMLTSSIVCFIEIRRVNRDTTVNNFVKRVIGGEYERVLVERLIDENVLLNGVCLGRFSVVRFA